MNLAYTVHIFSQNPGQGSEIVDVVAPMPEAFTFDTSSEYEAPFTQGLTGNAAVDTMLKVGAGLRIVNQNLTAQIWQGSADTQLGLELEFHAESDPVAEVQRPILQLMKLTTPTTMGDGGYLMSPGPKIDAGAVGALISSYGGAASQAGEAAGGFLSGLFGGGGEKEASLVDPSQTATNGNSQAMQAQTPQQNSQYGANNSFKAHIKDQISIRVGRIAFFDSVVITNVQKTYESKFDAITGLPHHAKVSIQFKPLFMIIQQDLDRIFTGASPSSGPTPQLGDTASTIDRAEAFPVEPPSNPVPAPIPTPAQTYPVGSAPFPDPSPEFRPRTAQTFPVT